MTTSSALALDYLIDWISKVFFQFIYFHDMIIWATFFYKRRGQFSICILSSISITPATKKVALYMWAKFSFDFELVLTILRRFFAALQRFRPTDAGNQLPGRLFFQVWYFYTYWQGPGMELKPYLTYGIIREI